ncbi:MAG TPA: DUF5683 domain-containing protein [Bacteroidia bacterium]|jgi:hypothetical protein|nr:DUF5683 domain-containing protein [Bacteroidia bacterium]
MRKNKIIFYFVLLFSISGLVISQKADTVKVDKKLSKKAIYREARKATIMSAIIPGLGQAYNRRWWKVPIVYAGLGGFGYLFYINQRQYAFYAKNLKAENDGDPNTINETKYSSDQLLVLKNNYRKNRDLGFIGMSIIYIFNMVDANVDAHLRTFDVSDDLTLQIKPYSNVYCLNNSVGLQTGLSLNLKFRKKPQISRIYTDYDDLR